MSAAVIDVPASTGQGDPLPSGRGLITDTIRFSWVDGPGNRYTIFFQGCNLNCLACHNPHTIPLRTPRAKQSDIDAVVADIGRYAAFLTGVTVSGGESMLQAPFIAELFAALKAGPVTAGLTRLIDSAGHIPEESWDLVAPVTDGVMLDLKSLDDEIHRELTTVGNAQILASLDHLAARMLLAQVRLLIVPGYNDSEELQRRTGRYLAERAPGVPIQITGYRPHGVRAAARNISAPTEAQRSLFADWICESVPRELVTVV